MLKSTYRVYGLVLVLYAIVHFVSLYGFNGGFLWWLGDRGYYFFIVSFIIFGAVLFLYDYTSSSYKKEQAIFKSLSSMKWLVVVCWAILFWLFYPTIIRIVLPPAENFPPALTIPPPVIPS